MPRIHEALDLNPSMALKMVVDTCNSSTWEAEEGLLGLQEQPELQSKSASGQQSNVIHMYS